MNISITPAANGYILRSTDPDDPAVVYQDTSPDEVEAFADFLRLLLDTYGPSTSRYSPKRVVIRVEPGDKYERA
jgi:hypothetical protein